MLDEVDVLPVIHACPLQMFVINLKTEWVDEVQTRTDRQECSSGISCVVGNQRGAENHVQAFKRSNVQAFKPSNVQTFKRSSVQAFKRSSGGP